MATILLSGTFRQFLRPVIVDPEELFCTPVATPGLKNVWPIPAGDYDVAKVLKTLPASHRDPSLLVSFFDTQCLARNLASITCPRVLLLGDTHHRPAPLRSAINYALTEPYDLIVVQFTRHHLHFFREAGLRQATWLPSFTLTPFEIPPGPRSRETLFVGYTDNHPYRRRVLTTLEKLGCPVPIGTAPPPVAAQSYNQTRINLNVSLNGDFNLRNFEILAAGGFLLTDRLSPESGFEQLFQDRRHLRLFDSAEHARDLITHYLAHPQEAEVLAAAGHAEYLHRHTPAQKIQDLHAALNGTFADRYAVDSDRRINLPPEDPARLNARLGVYELLQETHRSNHALKVLFGFGMQRAAIDAVDLPRMTRALLQEPGPDLVAACELESRIERVTLPLPSPRAWDIFCIHADTLNDPALHPLIARPVARYLLVGHFDPAKHHAPLALLTQQLNLKRIENIDPPMLLVP